MAIVRDQSYHCCVIGKLNGVGVIPGHEVMSEQGVQEGTEHAPSRAPRVEDERGRFVVTHSTLTTWGRPIRKSRIQLQREVFSPQRYNREQKYYVTRIPGPPIEMCLLLRKSGNT
jgi:hypothetical protein